MSRRLTAAVREVRAAKESAARWAADVDLLEGQLGVLQAGAGEAALADPKRAESLPGELRDVEGKLDVARRTTATAEAKLRTVQAEALEIAAQGHDADAAKSGQALNLHHERTAELLAALEEHEGHYIPAAESRSHATETVALTGQVVRTWEAPKSVALFREVKRSELRAAILRDMAAGIDPAGRISNAMNTHDGTVYGLSPAEIYPPEVWGPDAIVPATQYLGQIERLHTELANFDRADAVSVQQRIDRFTEQADQLEQKGQAQKVRTGVGLDRVERHEFNRLRKVIEDLQAEREKAPLRRRAIVDALEKLTGQSDESAAA